MSLIYSVLASLDGYVEDASGSFDWAEPDPEVHQFVNDLERSVGIYLYGRRMYDTMRYWQDPPDLEGQLPHIQDYAKIWQGAEKVVYSRTLDNALTPNTRIESEFEPEAVRQLKANAARDISIGGAELAAHAIEAGLVDEYHLFLVPVAVGRGKHALPDGVRVELELLAERRFTNGTVYLRYRPR